MTEFLQEILKAQKNALLFWVLPTFFLIVFALILANLEVQDTKVLVMASIAIFWLLIGLIRAMYFFFKFTFYLKR